MRALDDIQRDLAAARDRRDRITTDLEALHGEAGDEPLRGGDTERWENLSRGLAKARTEIERLEDEARANLGEGVRSGRYSTEDAWVEPGSSTPRDPTREAALRAIERHAEFSTDEVLTRLETVVRHRDPTGILSRYLTAVGSDAYRIAFSKMLADPQMGHLKFGPEEVEAVRLADRSVAERALATTTTGVPVPYQLDPTLIFAGSGALNPFRDICRVETVTEGTWKGVNTQDVTLAYSAEATEATDNTPTLAQPSVTTQRVLGFVPFSIELSQDWPTVASELTQALADGKDILDATKFLTGSGTNEPQGVLTGLTTSSMGGPVTIVRSLPGIELRDGDGLGKLFGRLAVFDRWAEIDSSTEGHFVERVAPGAFARSIERDAARYRALFHHGHDPSIGPKPLGPVTALGEDERGAYYEVSLIDTSYNRDLLPGLRAGLYGSSFRGVVVDEGFDRYPARSDHNPTELPERTIREVSLVDFGPTPFPAYVAATAGARSVLRRDRWTAACRRTLLLMADGG